ncbi:vWA domain-containing protein [Sulfurospirillum sp. 1612]|uniref:vWA domain-containing protein n=1 Tax=Sulfurospirillum sp. 1612 TaxID=3094835 RepID=UPI002F9503C3
MLNQVIFEYPLAFVIILVFIVCQIFCKQKNDALFFPTIKFMKKAAKKTLFLENILKFLIVLLLSTALASPIKQDEISIQNDKGYEISLILDASGSMAENNKFGIVKQIVGNFLDKRVHDKIGLSIFGDFAYVAVPLTYDKESIKRLLSRLNVGVAGSQATALYEALFLSSNLFKHSHAKKKIAILLTDGMNNVNTIPLSVAIKTVQKYGIKVYTVGIGNPGDYDPNILHEIAQKSGGKFFEANSVNKLQAIYDTINRLEKSQIKANKYMKKRYLFAYPLAGALGLMLVLLLMRNKESL